MAAQVVKQPCSKIAEALTSPDPISGCTSPPQGVRRLLFECTDKSSVTMLAIMPNQACKSLGAVILGATALALDLCWARQEVK